MVAALMAGVALGPASASAHAILESTSPVASSVIPDSPSLIQLRFNEPIERELASIRLFDENRNEVAIGPVEVPAADRSTAVVETIPALDDGVYVVVWRVVSADGHPVTGAFPFQVGGTVTDIESNVVEQLLAGLATTSDLGVPLGIGRFAAFVGALVLVGAVVFTWGSPLAGHRRVVGVQLTSLLLLVAGSGLVLVMQGAYASGRSWGSVGDTSLIADVMGTRLGAAILARLALGAGWIALVGIALRGAWASRAWMNAAVLTSLATLATFAVSGHASTKSPAALFAAVDLVHLVAVASWAGALVTCAVLRVRPGPDLDREIARFSRLATVSMPVAVVTGVVLGFGLLGGISTVTDTNYGVLLLAKIAAVALVVAAGARVRRRLGTGSEVRRGALIRFEAVMVMVVLGLTTLLVGASPNPATPFRQSFGANLAQGDVLVDFQVSPAWVGTAEVHALFTVPGGTLNPVVNVTVSLSLPEADVPNIPVTMVELGPNHWSGVVKIPYAGLWRAEVRVAPTDNAQVLLGTNVPIKG